MWRYFQPPLLLVAVQLDTYTEITRAPEEMGAVGCHGIRLASTLPRRLLGCSSFCPLTASQHSSGLEKYRVPGGSGFDPNTREAEVEFKASLPTE